MMRGLGRSYLRKIALEVSTKNEGIRCTAILETRLFCWQFTVGDATFGVSGGVRSLCPLRGINYCTVLQMGFPSIGIQ
jgi:hypothetical protein